MLCAVHVCKNHQFSSATSLCLLSQTHRSSSVGGGLSTCFAELGPQRVRFKSLHLEAFLYMPNFMHLSSPRAFNGPAYMCEVTCVPVSERPGSSTKLLCLEV